MPENVTGIPAPLNASSLPAGLTEPLRRTPAAVSLFDPQPEIRIATPKDQKFIDSLALKYARNVGFLPRPALDWYIEAGCVRLVLENGLPAGYFLSRMFLRWNAAIRPITQTAICFDAQRMHLGAALVADAEESSCQAGQMALAAHVRDGLEANAFFEALGFEKICQLDPRAARRKLINVWRKQLTPLRPTWFTSPPAVAGHTARKVIHP